MQRTRKSMLVRTLAAAGMSLSTALLSGAHAGEPNGAPSPANGDLRSNAATAVRQGHPELALPMYDALLQQAQMDPKVFEEAHLAAMRAHDFKRAASYGERQLAAQPDNFSVIQQLAFSYHMAGDSGNFEKARERAFKYRLSTTDKSIQSDRLLFDYFKAGQALVFVNQCYKASPPFRIKYRFDVMDDGAAEKQLPRTFLVLENLLVDDQVAKELTGETRPHFSLDAFENYRTVHRTIQPYLGEPSYDVVKAPVIDYLKNSGPVTSSSTAPAGKKFAGDCSPVHEAE